MRIGKDEKKRQSSDQGQMRSRTLACRERSVRAASVPEIRLLKRCDRTKTDCTGFCRIRCIELNGFNPGNQLDRVAIRFPGIQCDGGNSRDWIFLKPNAIVCVGLKRRYSTGSLHYGSILWIQKGWVPSWFIVEVVWCAQWLHSVIASRRKRLWNFRRIAKTTWYAWRHFNGRPYVGCDRVVGLGGFVAIGHVWKRLLGILGRFPIDCHHGNTLNVHWVFHGLGRRKAGCTSAIKTGLSHRVWVV